MYFTVNVFNLNYSVLQLGHTATVAVSGYRWNMERLRQSKTQLSSIEVQIPVMWSGKSVDKLVRVYSYTTIAKK